MQLQTTVTIPQSSSPIDYAHKLLLVGSCFAENIGNKLTANKFQVDVNPFGILYNPLSIKSALQDLIDNRLFCDNDLFEHQGIYNSFAHHSRFSATDADSCLSAINKRMDYSSKWLAESDYLIVTFGTAFVYFHKESNEVVSNCHKLPDSNFRRERISVERIVKEWQVLITKLQAFNPNIKILFTVSPIRHWKDGAHDNQLSKSTLLLAIDELVNEFDFCSYFAAYELVMDELRDYRFYAEDMIHPSNQTVDYIWQRFCETHLSKATQQQMAEWHDLQKALAHRPFNPKSETYKRFLEQNLAKLEQLTKKSPYFALSTEIAQLREQLQSFESL